MNPPEMVLVEWEDAARLDSETWADNVPMSEAKPVVFQTLGYLLYSDEHRIVVTGSWSKDTIGPRDQIPRGMIRSMLKLKTVRAS